MLLRRPIRSESAPNPGGGLPEIGNKIQAEGTATAWTTLIAQAAGLKRVITRVQKSCPGNRRAIADVSCVAPMLARVVAKIEERLRYCLERRRTGGFCFRAGKVAAATREHDEKGEDENRKHSVCRDQPRAMISMAPEPCRPMKAASGASTTATVTPAKSAAPATRK
jgi:hypothetical protein